MNILDKIKNRYNIITFVLILLMLALSIRLATLTIAQGDYYRDLADNKRLKEVYTTAPRGEIRDRYGRLLAGNKSSFTVQLLKDELNRLDLKTRNQAYLDLIRLLEEDGVTYVDELPIQLNVFKYRTEGDYQKESLEPIDKVIQLIMDNNLIPRLVDSHYVHRDYLGHFKFITANKTIRAILEKGIDLPIETDIQEGQVQIFFDEKIDIDRWKRSKGIPSGASARDILIQYLEEDTTILRKTIDHSLSRKLVYDILVENDLVDNIYLEEIAITYEEEYLSQKRHLSNIYPRITLTSSAKDDFVNIAKQFPLMNFLETSYEKEDGGRIIPGQVLLDFLKEDNISLPLEITLADDNSTVLYKYTGNEDLGDESPVNLLIRSAEEAGILIDFVTDEEILYFLQLQMSNQGISPIYSIDELTSEDLPLGAVEDFIDTTKQSPLKNFLETSIQREDEDRLIPGKVLLDLIREKGVEVPIEAELGDDESSVIYRYTGNIDIGDENLVDLLINYAERAGVLADFITRDDIKYSVQSQLLRDGINPRISVANNFQYVEINNLIQFYTSSKVIDVEEGENPNIQSLLNKDKEEVFKKLRDRYEIDEGLSIYEARKILIIHEEIRKQGYLAYNPINIAYGIKDATVAKIEETSAEVPGISVSVEPVRYYPEGHSAAHILGYLGKISQANEIEKYVEELKYSPNELIGKTGIEESFEEILKGKNGVKEVEVDSVGNTTGVLTEEKPIPGNNVYLTIDLKLQQVAEQALKHTLEEISRGGTYRSPWGWGDYTYGINKRKRKPYVANSGAVVAIDVKTGQVLASASYPAYDPNLFSIGISKTDWESLFPENDKDQLAPRPLYNIVTQTAVEPGSIYKMATGLTALEKGLDPKLRIRDMGKVDIGNDSFKCHIWTGSGRTHGFVNVYEALRDSCNYYFYTLALGYNQKTGANIGVKIDVEDIAEMSKKLGLNDKTGIEINIPAEVSGVIPDPQRKLLNTKALLKSVLNRKLEKYYKEDREYDEDFKEKAIEEILTWLEYDEPLSRGEVVRRLEDMGINSELRLPGDREGLADIIKYTYINYGSWRLSDTINVTIGQGAGAYTPIQMANYVATIANGGYKHKLTLIDNVKNYNNSETQYAHDPNPDRIELNDYENLEHIKRGMKMVSESGTARRVFQNFPIEVGVKTGTAQKTGINPSTGEVYDDFAWFVGFAPYDEPEIAVAALIFQGGSGGYAGPMVRDIMAEYLGLNDSSIDDNLPYENFPTR